MGLIVVDASVAVKWALKEADSDAAAALLDDDDPLLAPELLRIEGASAITRAGRSGRVAVSDVEDVVARWLRSLEAGAVELWPDRADLARAVTLSCELRHPLPDCLYLALAERTDAELVTADATFVRRVSELLPARQTARRRCLSACSSSPATSPSRGCGRCWPGWARRRSRGRCGISA